MRTIPLVPNISAAEQAYSTCNALLQIVACYEKVAPIFATCWKKKEE